MVLNIQKIILVQNDLRAQNFNGLVSFHKWQLNNAATTPKRSALLKYRNWVVSAEALLERKYQLKPGTLEGILAALVTIQEAERILSNEKLRKLFIDPRNVIIVQISQSHPIILITIHTRDNIHVMKVGMTKSGMQSVY